MGQNIVLLADHVLPATVCKRRHLIIRPIPPLSTARDVALIEKIELHTADGRFIARFVRVTEGE